jgi:hypothetical protein
MEYYRGEIHVLYYDANGNYQRIICEPLYNDRWRVRPVLSLVFPFTETDTGTMIEAYSGASNIQFDMFDQQVATQLPFTVTLPWMELGSQSISKLLEECYLDLDISGNAAPATISIDILTNFSDVAVDTITINPTNPPFSSGRTLASILPNQLHRGPGGVSNLYSFGREARVFSYRIYGTNNGNRITLYSLEFKYQELGQLTGGSMTDWMNIGYKYDKKLYQMSVEFDAAGLDQLIFMDTLTGRDGNTLNERALVFTLSNPVIVTGNSRALKSFPIPDGIVVKEVRLYSAIGGPATPAGEPVTDFFKIINVDFQKEDYPPDVTVFTPWDNGGYEYDKYCNQVDLSVNTNNVPVTIQVQADGNTVFSFQVTTTDANRRFNATMPPRIKGKQWRIYVDPNQDALTSGTGLFQLFYTQGIFKFQPADRGEVIHSTDWNDLGHPWDKYLINVTFEWDLGDAPANSSVTLQMDTISGINGQTLTPNVASFVLGGSIRGKKNFPLPVDLIAKMVQIYPTSGPPLAYKQWNYIFSKIDYPADNITATDWRDAQSPDDKNPSWIYIDADTNGVPATIQLQNEIGTVMTFTHTGTVDNRKANYPIPVDQFAKMWRLLSTSGGGGKFQLFQWGFARWHPFDQGGPEDPPDTVLWTPWNDFGWPYEKIARNFIITASTGNDALQVQVETESGPVQIFTINGIGNVQRRFFFPFNSNISGKQFRVTTFSPPVPPDKFKLWDWSIDYIKEPAAVNFWDSYEQTFGYKFFKFVKQIWIMYKCLSTITYTITSDTGTFSIVLPPHANRTEERFYLPEVWGAGLNKSKVYRITVAGTSQVFKFYAEGSGIEFMPIGKDQHASYSQTTLSEFMTMGE